MRFYGEHGFLGRPVTGFDAAEGWLAEPAAEAVAKAQAEVSAQGYTHKVYDCYRLQRATDDFVA